MRNYYACAARLGRDITVRSAEAPAGRPARGSIEPLAGTDTEKLKLRARPGTVNNEKYLLISGPDAIVPGETDVTVTAGGMRYALLRAEPVYIGGVLGHWEGVLRLKGGSEDE